MDGNDEHDGYVVIGKSEEIQSLPSLPNLRMQWLKQKLNTVLLLNGCLGLVDTTPYRKKWQRGCCYVHRGIICTLLVFTCAIQILVCFRRDGFVISLSQSNLNESICNVEQHVIISNLMQEALVITAYVLLLWYTTKWQLEMKDLIQEITEVTVTATRDYCSKTRQRCMYAVIPLWIVLSFTARLMQALAFGLLPNETYDVVILYKAGPHILPAAAQITLGTFCLVGFVLFDFVYLAVVMTYVIQCELVRRAVAARSNDIHDRRQNRIALTLEEAIQSIGSLRKYLQYINGKVSWLVSVVFFNFASSAVIGLWSTNQLLKDDVQYKYNIVAASIARAIGTILWVLLLVIPLVQAARLTAACTHLKKSACDLLEDQAANWAQAGNRGCQLTEAEAANADDERNKRFQLAELYTLYLNTVSSSLKAKIFGIPIHSWAVYSAMVLFAFVLLILTQTNTYVFFSPVF